MSKSLRYYLEIEELVGRSWVRLEKLIYFVLEQLIVSKLFESHFVTVFKAESSREKVSDHLSTVAKLPISLAYIAYKRE